MINNFDLSNELFEIVPFSKYALWKHKVEKTVTLWVELHSDIYNKKYNVQGEGGTLNVAKILYQIFHQI